MNELASMMKFKGYLTAGIIVVVIIVIIYYVGRKSGSVKIEQIPLPNDSASGKTLTEQEGQQVRALSISLYKDMKGLNAFTRNEAAYRELSTLSDTLFVAVYNDFNTLYGKEGETLKQWIENEKSMSLNVLQPWAYNFSFAELKETILSRMNRLNLQ